MTSTNSQKSLLSTLSLLEEQCSGTRECSRNDMLFWTHCSKCSRNNKGIVKNIFKYEVLIIEGVLT